MDKKSMLAIVLSFMVLYIYQAFFVKPLPPKQAARQNATAALEKTVENATGQSSVVQAKSIGPLQQIKNVEYKDIPVDTPEYSAVFTSRGGALKSFKLKQYRETIDKESNPIDLVRLNGSTDYPLNLSFTGSDFDIPADAVYEVSTGSTDLRNSAGIRQLTFVLEYPGAVKIEKTYRSHPGRYNFDLELKVTNLSEKAVNLLTGLNWHQYVDPQQPKDSYGHDGPISLILNKIEREDEIKMATTKTLGPDVSWGGFESKYFIAALIPQNPSLTSFVMSRESGDMLTLSLKSPKNIIPPGQENVINYSLYLGPKDYSILKTSNIGLEYSIDFGDWLKWLAMPMLIVLKFLYNNVATNYGIAIIILTALIKIAFWPLGNKSYRSMKEMQKLQPKIQELRDKYKDDKARISQEMMALYKAHKVNPMGGCLPMVIQIPVFFGLYKTLLFAIELRHSPFIWWIQDLSAKDPYYVTPIIMGATMFLQQKMTPPAGDPMQAKIMLFMPIIFTFMFLNFPSGLVIYWLFNNIISIGQQYYINKKLS